MSSGIRHLALILTTRCNLRCDYCLLRPTERRTVSWPSLQTSLDGVLASTADDLDVLFTGGEPLLAFPVLVRAVQHLEGRHERRRCRYELGTNGVLLSDEVASFLERHRFVVTVSFDGVPDAQLHRGHGTFERLDSLLRRLARDHPSLFERLRIGMTVSPGTVDFLAESIAYFLRNGVRTVAIGPAVPGTSWTPDQITWLDAQFGRAASLAAAHYREAGTVPLLLFRKFEPDPRAALPEYTCSAPLGGSLVVDPNGTAYGCALAAEVFHSHAATVLREAADALALGPVDAPGFETRLASMRTRARACGVYTHPEERYSSYRRCRDCEYLGRCYACPLAAASVPHWDDVRRVPDFVCAWNQVALAHRDRFPCQTTGSAL